MKNLLIAVAIFAVVGVWVGSKVVNLPVRGAVAETEGDGTGPVGVLSKLSAATLGLLEAGLDSIDREDDYYQYIDASGEVRFVKTLEEVPPDLRAVAGIVRLDRPPPARPDEAYTWKRDAAVSEQSKHASKVAEKAARTEASAVTSAPNVSRPGSGKGVVVYVSPGCKECRQVSDYLRDNGVDFTMKNIRSGTRTLMELKDRTGNVTTPTVAYGGMVVQLYRPDELDAIILRAKGAS